MSGRLTLGYVNTRQKGRLSTTSKIENAYAQLFISNPPPRAQQIDLIGAEAEKTLYRLDEHILPEPERHLYNFPFLYQKDGTPWMEANSYLLSYVSSFSSKKRPTDLARRRASKLLDYLMYCEDEDISWLDFSAVRPTSRPTYRYFKHLKTVGGRSAAVINQYTGVVYDFYKFVSAYWHTIDLRRVDTVKSISFMVSGDYGAKRIEKEQRSQSLAVPPPTPVSIGYVRDDGEDLRPLANSELADLLRVINSTSWTVVERLIFMASLMTGARKQSVLTLRLKHIKRFVEDNLNRGSYVVHAGPGTGIDTKNGVKQRLYFPKQLAEELAVYAHSPLAKRRQEKFRARYRVENPGVPELEDEDVYVFLSDQGGCYYMAETDPRYATYKSPPKGQITDNLKKKLLSKASMHFPKDFTFHWLRATFAFQLYQLLLPLIQSGELKHGEEISFIQSRMHHAKRETTENYLKLFKMHFDKLMTQELYESYLLGFSSYDDLKVRDE